MANNLYNLLIWLFDGEDILNWKMKYEIWTKISLKREHTFSCYIEYFSSSRASRAFNEIPIFVQQTGERIKFAQTQYFTDSDGGNLSCTNHNLFMSQFDINKKQ